jgi:hypothetical protein
VTNDAAGFANYQMVKFGPWSCLSRSVEIGTSESGSEMEIFLKFFLNWGIQDVGHYYLELS